ncbi:hepcidin-like [Huso huso]|uniref:Preprohepcidin n=3 Tax=Acipenseridae TaxID=7900 RepID=A0A4P8DH48_ACIBE|nr:hepcidin-like [Acipenser ruthenus]XP_058867099.1 hepcidin-like [Acipenser ruthenus]QCL07909.1 preprohepcidin [Acipenser baerii]QCL07910.1 preprohepcidin [Acipenser baerii]
MKLISAIVLIVLLSVWTRASSSVPLSETEDQDRQQHLSSVNDQQTAVSTEAHGPLSSLLLREKRQSHFPICLYCCNCCKNKGCGYCCRT